MNPNRATFPGLSPDHFTHPADAAALRTVRDLPLINTVLKKMFQYGFEKMLRVQAMSETVKATRRTYPRIYEMTADVAARLDIPAPDVFIQQHPVPNALTTGAEYPFLHLRSGLLDLLSEDEVYTVIAHEAGHIKCGHVLYLMAGRFLTVMASMLGLVGLPLQGLRLALLEWSRKAELTCDRAALLCTQDVGLVQASLMRLAGGSYRLSDQIDFEDFLTQGRMFDAMTAGLNLNKFYRMLAVLPMTHPFPVVRAAEINAWSHSEQYGALVRGDYERQEPPARKTPAKCPHCGAGLSGTETHCPACANMVVAMGPSYRSAGDEFVSDTLGQAATAFTETMSKAFDDLRGLFMGSAGAKAAADAAAAAAEAAAQAGAAAEVRIDQVCTACGTVNDVDARFCKHCGAKLGE